MIQILLEWEAIKDTVLVIAGIATAFAVIFLGYQTLKLRDERSQTLRAWVGESGAEILTHGYSNANDEFKSYEQWKDMSQTEKDSFNYTIIHRYFRLKNYGQIPAKELQKVVEFYISNEPTKTQIESLQFDSPSVLMPNDESKAFFDLTKERNDAFVDGTKTRYLVVNVKYKSSNSNKEKMMGYILKLEKGKGEPVKLWDEETFHEVFCD